MTKVNIVGGTFTEENHAYHDARGMRVPSVTQALASVGLVDFSRVRKEVLDRKRLIGTAVHSCCEYIDTPGAGELDWDTVDEAAVGYVLAFERFVEESGFQVYPGYVEKAGIHVVHNLAFGYRIDRAGTIRVNGHRLSVLLEIKCGVKAEPTWPLQLAAYGLTPLPPPEGAPTFKRVALQLRKDATFKLFPYDDPNDARHFLSALSLTHFKMAVAKVEPPDIPDDVDMEDEDGE